MKKNALFFSVCLFFPLISYSLSFNVSNNSTYQVKLEASCQKSAILEPRGIMQINCPKLQSAFISITPKIQNAHSQTCYAGSQSGFIRIDNYNGDVKCSFYPAPY